jgi:hypothetical protein
LQQAVEAGAAQPEVVVEVQADCYRHLLYRLLLAQAIPLLLEQEARRAHMTQEVVLMLAHLALIRHWVQLPLHLVAETAAPVIVLEQVAAQARVVLVAAAGIPTDLAPAL